MRYATVLAVGVVVVSLCGCGASHRRATTYSVQQVEEAFKAHGLRLHQARFGPAPGVVKLLHPGVEVEVDVGKQTESWISVSPGSQPSTSKANVIVDWHRRYTRPVRAALRQLN